MGNHWGCTVRRLGVGVTEFETSAEWRVRFDALKASSQLMAIHFHASWCGPSCHMEPIFVSMADKFTNVIFFRINIDKLADVAKEFDIQEMPTFVLVKQGKEVERILGASADELENEIGKHRAR